MRQKRGAGWTRLRKNGGFTILELAATLAVILILSTIAFTGFRHFIDVSRQKSCKIHLKILNSALKSYGSEHDALPATLGEITPVYFREAYAMVKEELGPTDRFFLAIEEFTIPKEAFAQFLTHENLRGEESTFTCPADKNGGASYGINGNIVGIRWDSIDPGVILIADSDSYVFTSSNDYALRHLKGFVTDNKAITIKKNGTVAEVASDDLGDPEQDTSMVCHNGQTLVIAGNSVQAHLDHGDTSGPCP